ncbi:HNH endonuclease signature motif containing protein [Caballeronia sp. LZ043]|nr:HNH endonuclease signature motif containing protein [Caballeronia sp. LZ043]
MQWRCPHCASEPVPKTKPIKRRSKPDYGSAGVRLSGSARLKRNDRIRERDGFKCTHCSVAVRRGEVDHIIPLKDGGTEDDSNCQLLCTGCHADKTRADMGFKPKYGANLDGTPRDKAHHWNEG